MLKANQAPQEFTEFYVTEEYDWLPLMSIFPRSEFVTFLINAVELMNIGHNIFAPKYSIICNE